MLPVGPAGHEIRIGDEDARRVRVRAEHAYGLARLDEQRLIALERAQRRHDLLVALPVARRLTDAAVHDELGRPLGDLGIEVVHQHAQRRFGEPAAAGELCAARGAQRDSGGGGSHGDLG
jgi:hypothetical protein